MEPDPMLTFAAVARILGVTAHTVTKLVDAGSLPAFRPSPDSTRRVWESDLVEYRQKLKFSQKRELTEVSKAAD